MPLAFSRQKRKNARIMGGSAKKPDPPPPITAPVRPDLQPEGDVAISARRKKGIQDTLLVSEPSAMLGSRTKLGSSTPQTPMYGGEP